DGISEEILNALARVGALHFAARTSCFAFRGTSIDAREIGRRVGVETLLDGSIRKAGNRVRIGVQLIDARNGYHLWSERFERDIELDPDFAAAWAGLATAHVYLFGSVGRDPHLRKAHNASTRALELDPELADTHVAAGQRFSMEQRYVEAAAEFERAIELDP